MAFGENPRMYPVPSSDILYAGRTDLICLMDGIETIIDFKTGTKPKPKDGYPEWRLQTAAYRNGAFAYGNGVVHLDKETGEMSWYDYTATFREDLEAFLYLVKFWRNRNVEKLDGQCPSVTTITGVLDKSGPLMWWAVNSMRDYLYEKFDDEFRDNEIVTCKIEWLYQMVEDGRKNFRKVSKKAMDIGTLTHDAIEQWLNHKIEPSKESPDEVIAGFVAFLDWWESRNIEVIETEKVIYGR